MDAGMYWGMALIVAGIGMSAYGLLPRVLPSDQRVIETIAPPEDAPLTKAHWGMAAILALALVVDIMKPASLGFVTPGMQREYGVDTATVAWLPLAALTGTVIGSFLWGMLADIYGRRAAIVLSAIVFIGTSICGAMPDFWWNVFMCLLMGMGAGGMLPVAYALLAEIMPTRHRGWMLVLIGGIGAVGGYFAASYLSALLQPEFGWRIMWFLNLPTGPCSSRCRRACRSLPASCNRWAGGRKPNANWRVLAQSCTRRPTLAWRITPTCLPPNRNSWASPLHLRLQPWPGGW
jgi:putative MFS transporter